MDMDGLKKDLKSALSVLPNEVLVTIPALVVKYMPEFEKVGPYMVEKITPHIMAAMFEKSTGILNVDGIKQAVTEVLNEFGIKEPSNAA